MAVSGVVIELGNIGRSEPLGGMCQAPEVPPPYIGIRDEETSPSRPTPNARDAPFRAVQPNKHQVDRVLAGLGSADQVHPAVAGKGRLDREAHSSIETVRRSFRGLPCGGDVCGGWIPWIQEAGYGIGVQQPIAALEFDGSGERRLSRTVRARDYRECGHAALGGVRRQFADDFVVFSGRGARQPADLKSSAIGAFHHIEAVAIEIENGKPGRERLREGLTARRLHRIVELSATEIVGHRHNQLYAPGADQA
jgi:hypothetical protein